MPLHSRATAAIAAGGDLAQLCDLTCAMPALGLQEDSLESARMVLKRTMGKLNVVYKQAQSNHLLLLVVFAVFLFLALYVLSKVYKIGRHVMG